MTMLPSRRPSLAWALLLLACAAPTTVRAQAVHEGKVTGTIADSGGAILPGATVEISSPALMAVAGKKSTTTSVHGTYVFLNLPVGKYTVTASLPGFKTIVRENIDVSPASSLTLDIALPVGAIAETVTVTAEGPVVDTKTSTVDSKIDKEMLAKLPTTRDAFYDLALTSPGMFDSSSSNTLPSPTSYGSATNENVFLINGVNATNPDAASFGTLVNVNYDAVEEVRVVALGSKAEYGSYSGAAIDVMTKSGSNDFHGTAAYYSMLGNPANNQPAAGADLGAPWLYVGEGEQLAGVTKSDWEGSATFGGPIIKDKLWFFGAFDYLKNASLPPRWSLETKSKNLYADGKVSAAPFKNHRAWVSYHYENNDSNGSSWGSEPAWDTSMNYGTGVKNDSVSAQWQWFPTGTTSASAKFLGFWKKDQPYLPADHASHPGYINWWKWADYGINGAFPYVDAQQASRQTIQADISHYTDAFLGQHDIKFGAQYTKGRGNRQEGYFQNYINYLYPYRWTQSVADMKSYYGDTGLIFYQYKDTQNPVLTVRTADSVGLFFDDQWSINKRLTVNVGLRYDGMTTKYGVGKVYDLVTSPDQINNPTVVRDRASTGNIFDFKTFSPRIGVSYALTSDNKTVARAAYGRYYMPLSLEFLRRYGPDMPLTTRERLLYNVGPWSLVDTNGDGIIDTQETRAAARLVNGLTPFETSTRTFDKSWTLNVDPNVKDQFTDQVTLNLEREIAKNLAVSATYIYKHTANLFANVPINRETGQEWDYERVPYTTSKGQQVNALQHRAQGLQRGRCDRRRRHHVDPRPQRIPGREHAGLRRDQVQARLPRAPADVQQEVLRPLAVSGVVPLLVFRGDGAPFAAPGRERPGPDVLGRQLDGEPQPDDQQPRRPAPLHSQVRVQGLGLVQGPQDRRGPRGPVPRGLREAVLAPGGLSPTYAVRGPGGERDRYRREAPSWPRTPPITFPRRPSSISISRRPSSSDSTRPSISSWTASTSSTRTRPPTSTCSSSTAR